ncbi:HAD family hydrolase [Streptomyces sp. NPDC058619]|uniref:HAD family hydrolase n=1 Tax=unclassified Streptomyces TaxID=2593676 RepID=UPI00364B93E8
MQRLALFDLDDTLIDRRHTLSAVITRFACRHGLDAAERAAVLDLVAERARPDDFSAVRSTYGLSSSAEDLWRAYVEDTAELTSCPENVLEGLDTLRGSGWRVAVATNGPADIQRAKLRATGIAGHVDAVCVSGEVGVRKPDRGLFAAAAQLCGMSVEKGGWMVGDDPVKDIAGGRAAGLRTVWIGSPSQWPAAHTPPDRAAPTARAALELLVEHSRPRRI